jgi:hypothetical protein
MIEAVVNHPNAPVRQTEKSVDIGGGEPAYGYKLILSSRQPGHNNASVKHARRTVFSRKAKWSEIVDSSDQRAGMRPEQAAVTRHVQHVEPELPDKLREMELMPEHIAHRRPVSFGDRHQFHRGGRKCEQRQVLFQNKQGEIVAAGLAKQRAHQC